MLAWTPWGFFITELMTFWEQVSEVAGVWTVSHITAAV